MEQENTQGINSRLEKEPWHICDTLLKSCRGGDYDSVLGDREHVKGTFREFVVYDTHQVYPEFIVWYRKCMASEQEDTVFTRLKKFRGTTPPGPQNIFIGKSIC